MSAYEARLLAQTSTRVAWEGPTDSADLTDWLFNLSEDDYNACTPVSRSHLTCALAHTDDGKRISINVEDIGGALIVEHYREVVSERLHCRVESISDLLIGRTYTNAHVIWEVKIETSESGSPEFVNNVWVHTTEDYDRYLFANRIPFEDAKKGYQSALAAHGGEETPNFAKSAMRRAAKLGIRPEF